MKTLIRDIELLVQAETTPRKLVKGTDMRTIPTLSNAWVLLSDDIIEDFGHNGNCPESADVIISAKGKMVFPSWCDSHTHIVYAGSREQEFVDRINGLSYEEIAKRGGGILNSAKRLQEASEDDLVESALGRLEEIQSFGTGAVEIKSGYGLTVESELKMLRVIKKLKGMSPLTIKATFLGAHAFPAKYKKDRQTYINMLTREMMPAIAEEHLADYCDVFCDRGFFTTKETAHILEIAKEYGLKPKIHANELDFSGGVQVGVEHNAISVDHLECVGEEEINVLLNSETMPTLLPSTAFFLNLEYAPARQMIDSGLPVALATDYNPGSTPSGRMPFVLSLACLKMNMLPEEAINAATLNGAYAMELQDQMGSIARGKKANLFVTKPIPSLAYLPYSFGSDLIDSIILNGKIQ